MSFGKLARGILILLAVPVLAQTAQTSTDTQPGNGQQAQAASAADPIDVRINLELQQALRERDAIIRNLLERVSELEWRVNGGFTSRPSDAEAAPSAPSLNSVNSVVANAGYDKVERQASEALDQALIVRGSLLLPPGMLELDNTMNYFSASADHVTVNGFALLPVLVVGDITSVRTRRDIILPTFTARLGLAARTQMEVQIPYGYELIRTVDATNAQTSTSNFGLGDINAAITHQFVIEHGSVPDILANIRFKSTTGADAYDLSSSETALGTGFNAIQGNLTMAKTSDPVVFFGNLTYTYNMKGDHTIPANDPNNPGATTVGHFAPGAAIGFQLGSILALNPVASVTLGWDQLFTRTTLLNGSPIPASYLVEGTLRIGTSYVYAPGKIVDLNFGVGLTPDTPNLQFSVGFPFRMHMWTPKMLRTATQ